MTYEPPTITEIGRVADFTQGRFDTGYEFREGNGNGNNGNGRGNQPTS